MTADAPITPDQNPRRAVRPLKVMLQIAGFALGIALLAWCVKLALRPENRPSLERILHADPRMIGALLGLCVMSLIANGSLFWVVIRPVYRAHWLSCCATNSLATFLNNFPFKLSLAARFLLHNRRDRLPLLTVAAWIGATAAVILAVIAAPFAATFWRGAVDGPWYGATAVMLVLAYGALVGLARVFAGEEGHARLVNIARVTRVSVLIKLLQSAAFARMHAGLNMLAGPSAVAGAMLARVADTAFIAGRFAIAAHLAGVEASAGSIVLASSFYFLIGAVTPSGALGTRDGGTLGALKFLPAAGAIKDEFAVVILTVTFAELVVNLFAASASALYLRFAPAHPATPVSHQP